MAKTTDVAAAQDVKDQEIAELRQQLAHAERRAAVAEGSPSAEPPQEWPTQVYAQGDNGTVLDRTVASPEERKKLTVDTGKVWVDSPADVGAAK